MKNRVDEIRKLLKIKGKIIAGKIRLFLPKLLISIFSIFIVLFFIELGLRIYSVRKGPLLFSLNYDYGYKLTPGFQGIFADVPVKINDQGLRENRDIVIPKPEGIKRILSLGDSVGFGYGVKEEKTYIRRLETILNNKEKRFETINGSVTGYNTFQERLFFEESLVKFNSDIIILNFVLNDVSGDFHVSNNVYRSITPFAIGTYSPEELKGFKKNYYGLYNGLYLLQFFHHKFPELFGFSKTRMSKQYLNYGEDTIYFYKKGYYYQKVYSNALARTEDEILRIRDLSQKNNAKLIVVIFPVGIQFIDSSLQKPQEIMNKFCQKNSLYCLDLLSLLKNQKEGVFLDLGHPSVFGSQIIAEEIARYLLKNNLL